jgi:hypothetical protein
MIQKFVQKNTVQPVPMQTTPTPVSVPTPTPFPSSNYIGFQNPFSQYQFNKR